MELIIILIIIIFIAKARERNKGDLSWETVQRKFEEETYNNMGVYEVATRHKKGFSPVVSRKYERNKPDNLPDELVEVYDVMRGIWQNYACESVFKPIYEGMETDPEEVLKSIEKSGLSIPMWVYLTLTFNLGEVDHHPAHKKLLSDINAKIRDLDEDSSVDLEVEVV